MKLIRFGQPGAEKPGVVLASGQRKDCSTSFPDWNHAFFAGGGLERLRGLDAGALAKLPDVAADARWGACVARPGKIIGIGLNFSDHAAEAGMPVPKEPIMFLKATSSFSGPNDAIVIPRKSVKTDWEVELGVVIGRSASYLDSPKAAAAHIAGYCVVNDVSEREFQLERGGQWTKGKSCDSFSPVGPWLATADGVADVNNLAMTLSVNGVRKQNGTTKTMVFDVYTIVHYLSQFMTLEAGDVITTGTPPGVGMGQKPPQYLKPGDVVELEIAGLGKQRQVCRAAD